MESFFKKLISSSKNKSNAHPAKKSSSGKHYCGKKSDYPCNCCNGICGPTNGCNCKACQALDIKVEGYIFNRIGYPAKADSSGKFYCMKRVLNCSCCSGHCSPNGCNCGDCNFLTIMNSGLSKNNFDGAKSVLSKNGKYYCGRKILSCMCCNGNCGPSNGCNCKACQWLDNSDVKSKFGGEWEILNSFIGLKLGEEVSMDVLRSLPGIENVYLLEDNKILQKGDMRVYIKNQCIIGFKLGEIL